MIFLVGLVLLVGGIVCGFIHDDIPQTLTFSKPQRGDIYLGDRSYVVSWTPDPIQGAYLRGDEPVDLHLIDPLGKFLAVRVANNIPLLSIGSVSLSVNGSHLPEEDGYRFLVRIKGNLTAVGVSEEFTVLNDEERERDLQVLARYERDKKLSEIAGSVGIVLLYAWVVWRFNKLFYGNVQGRARAAAAPLSQVDGEGSDNAITPVPESGDVPLRFRLLRWAYTDFKNVRLHANERPLLESVTQDDLALRFTAWRVWAVIFAILPFSIVTGFEVSDAVFTVAEADLFLDNAVMDVASPKLRVAELAISSLTLVARLVSLSLLFVSATSWRSWRESSRYLWLSFCFSVAPCVVVYLLPWTNIVNLRPAVTLDLTRLPVAEEDRANVILKSYADLYSRVVFLTAGLKEVGPLLLAVAPALQSACVLVRSAFPVDFWLNWVVQITPLLYLPCFLAAATFTAQVIGDKTAIAGVWILGLGQIAYVLSWNSSRIADPLKGRSFAVSVRLARLVCTVLGATLLAASYLSLSGPVTSAVANNSMGIVKLTLLYLGYAVVLKVIVADWLLHSIGAAVQRDEDRGDRNPALDCFRERASGISQLVHLKDTGYQGIFGEGPEVEDGRVVVGVDAEEVQEGGFEARSGRLSSTG